MERIVDSFIVRSPNKEGGLYLIDWPTGRGKTTQTAKFIAGSLKKDPERKIIYITTQRKNVQETWTKCKRRMKGDDGKLFNQKVIWLKSNSQFVFEWLEKTDGGRNCRLSEEITSNEAFKDMKDTYSIYKQANKSDTDIEEAIGKTERSFRNFLVGYLRREVGKEEKKALEKIRKREDLRELIDLYPQIELQEKRVIFCTVDKFMEMVSPIIGGNYRLWDEKRIDGTLIFIDEFDAAKGRMKSRQIEACYNEQLVDEFEYIKKVRASFYNPPTNFLFADGEGKGKNKNNRYVYESLKKIFLDEDYERLSYNFLYSGEEGKSTSFFYRGTESIIYSSGEAHGKYLIVEEQQGENDERDNLVRESNEEKTKLQEYIYDGSGLISYFVTGLAMMCNNLARVKKDSNEQDPLINIVSSVLKQFGISDDRGKKFFIPQILSSCFAYTSQAPADPLSPYYYDRGLTISYLSRDEEEIMSSRVDTLRLRSTPERFLYLLCQKAHVIGLSATCLIDTPLANFDLSYLKEKLEGKFVVQNEYEKGIMNSLTSWAKGAKDPEIEVMDNSITLEELVENEEEAEGFASDIERLITGEHENRDNENYHKRRFLKAMCAIKSFLHNKDSKALLLMRNQNPASSTKKLWNVSFIEDVLKAIKESDSGKYEYDYEVIPLTGGDFESKKKKIPQAVASGKKAIVLSCYKTVGIGQNLQYSLEENPEEYQDIDSIYLEMPTNLIVNLGTKHKGPTKENLLKVIAAISQIEELALRGYVDNKRLAIRDAFKRISPSSKSDGDRRSHLKCLYENEDFYLAAISVLAQAVGRLCRTNKNKLRKTIYVDQDIEQKIDFNLVKDIQFVPEFKKVCGLSKEKAKQPDSEREAAEEKAYNINKGLEDKIGGFLDSNNREGYDKSNREFWNDLRHGLLRHPNLAEGENASDFGVKPYCYMKAPKGKKIASYKIKEGKGAEHETISLIYEGEGEPMKILGMKQLLEIPLIKDYFEKEGITTSISPSPALICPSAYHDIYLGALGEELTKLIFEEVFKLKLLDIEDPKKFEKFDFQMEAFPNVYVDAKYWSTNSLEGTYKETNRETLTKKILKKLDAIEADKAIIVNASPINRGSKSFTIGTRILAIGSLYTSNKEYLEINVKVIDEILEFIK